MNRRLACLITTAILLLTGTAETTLAKPLSSSAPPGRAQALLVVRDYFTVLNAGMSTGDFSTLGSVYAAHATFTETLSVGQGGSFAPSSVVNGLPAIRNAYRALYAGYHGYHWTQDRVNRVSATMMVSYEHAQGPGLKTPLRSLTRYVIRNGKITSLEWSIHYLG